MEAEALDFVDHVCKTVHPKTILELGSGLSTAVFAQYVADFESEKPVVTSLEHDFNWYCSTNDMLIELGLEHEIRLILSENSDSWYSIEDQFLQESAGSDGFDLILIDGPPARIGRKAAVRKLDRLIGPDTVIIMDDCYRTEEQWMIGKWVSKGVELVERINTSRGLAVLRRQKRG